VKNNFRQFANTLHKEKEMAAFRKVFLALAVVAAVSSTAPAVFAQASAVLCTAGVALPVVRVEGLTEYVGDIFITCTGGNPTANGVLINTDNFELDLAASETTFTSRLLNANLPSVNGGYPYVESVLIINEAFPTGSQNPTTVPNPTVPPDEWAITQNCALSDQTGQCRFKGNGLGGWGTDGSDDSSSYGTGNSQGGQRPYNVFQGYQFSNQALRFDDIPVDPPGVGLATICYDDDSVCTTLTPEISFRITNVRVDATRFAAATPYSGFGPGIYATITVTGTQPVTFSNIGSNPVTNTNLELAVPEHSLHQVTVSEANSLICQDCSFYHDDELVSGAVTGDIDSYIYRHQTFSYYAQENFASAFEAQTWYYDDDGHYRKHDPHTVTGYGAGNHTPLSPYPLFSTQDIPGFAYFTASDFYPDGDTRLPQSSSGSGLIDPQETGQATNGLRLVFSINSMVPGVTLTAPAIGCLYGGTAPTGQHNLDHHPCTPAASDNPVVGGLAASGVAILLGAVTPNGTVDTDYGGPGSFYGFAPTDVAVTVASASEPVQFVYEIMYADGGFIETLWIPFDVNWCALTIAPLPPPVATAQVGLGPVSNGANTTTGLPNNQPSNWVAGEGDFEFPRFVWGAAGNPLPTQNVWYLDNCNCDLLFPYVAADAGFDTGFAISNTSADPYGTSRSDGYVQFFYYLNSLLGQTFVSPKDAYGRNLLGNDGVLAAGPASNVGPSGGTYAVYTNGVYDPANGINARSSFQQITFNPVSAGDQFIALLSTGAWVNGQKDLGWAGTPGFEGYIFAVSGFPYCHGFAFISNATTYQTQGYLALVIDTGHKLLRSDTWDFETTSGVLTTDPTWSYGTKGAITGGTQIYVLNPRDTNRDDYNN
jgi:hypothetical protein